MTNDNFYLTLSKRFQQYRDKPCLAGPDFSVTSYGDLESGIGRLASALQELGLVKGDRVLVQVSKSPMAVMLYLACLRQGFVFVPVNPAYTDEEVRYFLENAAPRLLVTDPQRLDAQKLMATEFSIPHCMTLDAEGKGTLAELSAQGEVEPALCEADDLAVLIYTSGTTGKPKGAMLSHSNLQANALTLSDLWGWQHDDVLIHALPVFHVHGLFVALHLPFLQGSTILFLSSFRAGSFIRLFPEATVLMGVPTFYTRLLKEPGLTKDVCRKMRLFISGSAPLLPETFNAFEEQTGHRILERYGMSEAGMLVSNPLDGAREPETVGFPLPDVQTHILDESGNEVSTDEIGMLEVSGPNVFAGYWQQPDKTAEAFHDDFFITGDLASKDQEGRISIVGRGRDLVITGGLNVYPREVEEALNQLNGVVESAVFGVPHPDFGEGLVAMLIIEENAGISSEMLLNSLKLSLSDYKIPKKLVFSETLPRNAMGKVQKSLLREQYAGLFSE